MEGMVEWAVGIGGLKNLGLLTIRTMVLGVSEVDPVDVVLIMELLDDVAFDSRPVLLGRGAIGRVLLTCLFLGLYAG